MDEAFQKAFREKPSPKKKCPFKYKHKELWDFDFKNGLMGEKKKPIVYNACHLTMGVKCVGEDVCPIMKK